MTADQQKGICHLLVRQFNGSASELQRNSGTQTQNPTLYSFCALHRKQTSETELNVLPNSGEQSACLVLLTNHQTYNNHLQPGK